MSARVEGSGSGNGSTNVDLNESQTLYFSTNAGGPGDDVAKAANDRFNQQEYSANPSSERTGYQVDEVPDSCCQKVGDCFRGFFSTHKTKTHTQ